MRLIVLILLLGSWMPIGCDPSSPDGEGTRKVASLLRPGAEAYNAILISIDTLRADHLACYGYHRMTAPALELFAARSVLFERAYCQSPWTTPSHASLFTSLYPSVLNLGDWPNPGKIDPKAVTLAERLRESGYQTAGFLEAGMVSGKFGFAQGFKPYKQGFKHIHESVPACLDWIREQGDERFFVFLHTYDVHRYDPPEMFRDRFIPAYEGRVEEGIPLARNLQDLKNHEFLGALNNTDREKIVSIYDEGIAYVDHWIGQFLDSIEAMGLMERTVVIITSDHGEEFWEHGHTGHGYTNFEEMLHVPLMIHHPDISPGRRSDLVRLIDIAPTLTEMLGVPVPEQWQGSSFFPILQGQTRSGIQFNFAEKGHVNRKSIQDDCWKLVRTYKPKSGGPPAYTDRLYNLLEDPIEQTDRAKDQPQELNRLKKLLDAWIAANRELQKRYQAIEVELDPELRDQLEKLGYTGGKR